MFANNSMIMFLVLGLLGGIANVLLWAESWSDLKRYDAFRRVIIGGIVGILYFFLYSEYNFPNCIMSFVAGYCGTDFIQAVVSKFRRER